MPNWVKDLAIIGGYLLLGLVLVIACLIGIWLDRWYHINILGV